GRVIGIPLEPIDPGVPIRRGVNQVESDLPGVIACLAALVSNRCHPRVSEVVLRIDRVAIRDRTVLELWKSHHVDGRAADGQPGSGVEGVDRGSIRWPAGK